MPLVRNACNILLPNNQILLNPLKLYEFQMHKI